MRHQLSYEKIGQYFLLIGCVSLFVLFPICCYGQQPAERLYFDHLTINDGLSHNTVSDVLQDRLGYIWIGTQNGLNKYDGYDLHIYRSGELRDGDIGLLGNAISCIFEDKAGNLWVGTGKHGINFKPSTSDRFVNLAADPAFAAVRGHKVTSIFEDAAGAIWITAINVGVLKYNPDTRTSRLYNHENSGLSNDLAFDVVEDKYGTIWVGTAGGGLNYLLGEDDFVLSHEMLPNHPNMGSYRKVLLLDDDYLWVGTEGTGLYRMYLKDKTYEHFAPGNEGHDINSNTVLDLLKTDDGKLLIATDGGGLNSYDPQTGKITQYTADAGGGSALNTNALTCLSNDRTGNVWIGTYNGGLNIYKPHQTWFEQITPDTGPKDGLNQRSVLSISQDENGEIWIGTDGNGIKALDPGSGQFMETPEAATTLDDRAVKTIFVDSRNTRWLGVFDEGLIHLDPQSGLHQSVLSDNSANVWSIAAGPGGELWVATLGDGLNIIAYPSGRVRSLRYDPADSTSLADNNVMTVYADCQAQIWVGTLDNGLDRWDPVSKRFIHYRHDPRDSASLSNNEVRTIFQDSRGELWVGTEGGGLNRWLGKGCFERITTGDGLIANSVMGITEDSAGLLWVTTFEGISRLDPQTREIRNFSFRSSRNANQFNQEAILAAADGTLYFGGINGLNAIHPAQVKEELRDPEVLLTGLRIYDEPVPVGELPNGRTVLRSPIETADRLRLSYLDNAFSLSFAALDYTDPAGHQFNYKLEGFDDSWHATALGGHSVNYTNLAPGTYNFVVKHGQKQASIIIDIKPPFWQTWWFRLLAVASLVAVVWYGIVFYLERKEARHQRQILELQNEKLAAEVEAKASKLAYSAVQMAHKNEILTDLKQDIATLPDGPEQQLRQLARKLDRELTNEDYWDEFNLYFSQVNQDFSGDMLKKHPELTPNDLRMCSLIRTNLSTKEIASLLNISTRGVEKSRYRLKKRLGLTREQDLIKYITLFGREGS